MNLLVVLSHLMSKDLELGSESVARAELAIAMFSRNEFDQLVTLGWDYRSDCTTPIADVVRDYIIKNSDIAASSITAIKNSRDTVGDAVYCLDVFGDRKPTHIKVITSDYHVERTKIIFNQVFNKNALIKVYGVNTAASLDPEILCHEKQSIESFHQTFKGVDFSSRRDIFEALSERHPFYNGNVHPKISVT
jgi:uncharacterized SAM-binding protein YcdF (DUF218 family)